MKKKQYFCAKIRKSSSKIKNNIIYRMTRFFNTILAKTTLFTGGAFVCKYYNP